MMALPECQRCQRIMDRSGVGRPPSYCSRCRVIVTRESAARRKREQRARQKENGASEVSASPVVIGSGHHNTVGSPRQVRHQKTSPAMFSPAPSSLGQRGALESFDLERSYREAAIWLEDFKLRYDRQKAWHRFLFI